MWADGPIPADTSSKYDTLCRMNYAGVSITLSLSRASSLYAGVSITLSRSLSLSLALPLSLPLCLFVCVSVPRHSHTGWEHVWVYVPPVWGRAYLSHTHSLTQALSLSLILFLRACLPPECEFVSVPRHAHTGWEHLWGLRATILLTAYLSLQQCATRSYSCRAAGGCVPAQP
jgi:hypothetical protein